MVKKKARIELIKKLFLEKELKDYVWFFIYSFN